MVDLEALIRNRQDQLRGRSESLWDRFKSRVRNNDWWIVGMFACAGVWLVCQLFILLVNVA